MKIKYTGMATVRLIENYRWDASNNFVQDVKEPEMVEELLTDPAGDFAEVKEPSAKEKSK